MKTEHVTDFIACQKLAVAVIIDAIKDIRWDQEQIAEYKNNKDKLSELRKKALNWIFANRFKKDFEFWCEAVGVDPSIIRKELKKYRRQGYENNRDNRFTREEQRRRSSGDLRRPRQGI